MRLVCHIGLLAVLLVTGLGLTGCSSEKTELHILNAGSLMIPMEQLETAFEKAYPKIDMIYEGHGSIQVIRHTTEIKDPASLAFVADYSLLPTLMYPALMDDGTPYADWHIQFATNQLGIAYTPESAHADEITADNWYELFRQDDVSIGFSDPRLDAVGYRSLMLLQLADIYYNDGLIFNDIIGKNFNARIKSVNTDGHYDIEVPELLESKNDRIYLRGFSVQLLALLETHQIDYAFEYESVALQHGLKFLPLPSQINLSDAAYADTYAEITVKLDFNRYKTVTPVFRGVPIVYGVTIPNSAPEPEAAAQFLEFLFSDEGQEILANNYQETIVPPRADNIDAVPGELKKYLE